MKKSRQTKSRNSRFSPRVLSTLPLPGPLQPLRDTAPLGFTVPGKANKPHCSTWTNACQLASFQRNNCPGHWPHG